MAAAEEVECVDEHMHPDINELLSKGIHRYTILYDKTLKEAKDHKMKSNAWKKITFPLACHTTQALWQGYNTGYWLFLLPFETLGVP